MEERLKKRLVGGAVLTSLVVIFVPMLFENDLGKRRSSELTIPPRPEISSNFGARILPGPDEDLARAPKVRTLHEIAPIPEPALAREATESAAKAPQQPMPAQNPDTAGRPRAWMLQVGSFSSRKNADLLVRRLRAMKFPAFHEEATVDRKTVFRVRVGPELDRKLAEGMQKRIAKEFKLDGQLVRYP